MISFDTPVDDRFDTPASYGVCAAGVLKTRSSPRAKSAAVVLEVLLVATQG
jgi:hypothetical protein